MVLTGTTLTFTDIYIRYSVVFSSTQILIPYKEEVTGSNPVAPTSVFQKSTLLKYKKPHNNRTFLVTIILNIKKSIKHLIVICLVCSCYMKRKVTGNYLQQFFHFDSKELCDQHPFGIFQIFLHNHQV